ncbi:MAG: dockerin type I repeat-containing protein [candidate division Zixibacteria bacterium]|nr:dockerin type I repeat-containing protein [candidate division Zixibacteria bacterium]
MEVRSKIGDANDDGKINVVDVVFLINYLFAEGPEPDPWENGDVNCDGEINIEDVVYLISYLFKEGPSPCP